MEPQNQQEMMSIVGELYISLYRNQRVIRNLQLQLGDKDQIIADCNTQIQALEQELSKHKTTIFLEQNSKVVEDEQQSG